MVCYAIAIRKAKGRLCICMSLYLLFRHAIISWSYLSVSSVLGIDFLKSRFSVLGFPYLNLLSIVSLINSVIQSVLSSLKSIIGLVTVCSFMSLSYGFVFWMTKSKWRQNLGVSIEINLSREWQSKVFPAFWSVIFLSLSLLFSAWDREQQNDEWAREK